MNLAITVIGGIFCNRHRQSFILLYKYDDNDQKNTIYFIVRKRYK